MTILVMSTIIMLLMVTFINIKISTANITINTFPIVIVVTPSWGWGLNKDFRL